TYDYSQMAAFCLAPFQLVPFQLILANTKAGGAGVAPTIATPKISPKLSWNGTSRFLQAIRGDFASFSLKPAGGANWRLQRGSHQSILPAPSSRDTPPAA